MLKRVRYRKDDNRLISINEIVSKNGARYQVYVDTINKLYVIRNIVSMRKFQGGEGINNMNVLKRKIKAHLKSLGVVFEVESRNRTFGLCNKGENQQTHLAKLKEQKE